MRKKLLITGGAGFIGSHVVRHFVGHYADRYDVFNLDHLTYAGNLDNLTDVARAENYHFCRGDIGDAPQVESLFAEHRFEAVVNIAAESHVDRSISAPCEFVKTNVLGTTVLLEAARRHWQERSDCRFYQVSTDEVYGALGDQGSFTETTPYAPRSPYAASKAAADHLVRAFHATFGLPTLISNCSNNYGPNQFPEKLIPLCIHNLIQGKPLPVYGQGLNVRDWLYVEDHVQAIDHILHQGNPGETYNVGGDCEVRNIDLVRALCSVVDEALNRPVGTSAQQIHFVADRLGHDYRYAVDFSKIHRELGWSPRMTLSNGLRKTVAWYLANSVWLERILSGAYRPLA